MTRLSANPNRFDYPLKKIGLSSFTKTQGNLVVIPTVYTSAATRLAVIWRELRLPPTGRRSSTAGRRQARPASCWQGLTTLRSSKPFPALMACWVAPCWSRCVCQNRFCIHDNVELRACCRAVGEQLKPVCNGRPVAPATRRTGLFSMVKRARFANIRCRFQAFF